MLSGIIVFQSYYARESNTENTLMRLINVITMVTILIISIVILFLSGKQSYGGGFSSFGVSIWIDTIGYLLFSTYTYQSKFKLQFFSSHGQRLLSLSSLGLIK